MNIAFRADSSSKIGIGHVMRCLTLAQELSSRGNVITFISRDLPGNINYKIIEAGYRLIGLRCGDQKVVDDLPYGYDWLGTTLDREYLDMKFVLETNSFNWVIVDHYSLDKDWESIVRTFGIHVLAIDDLANKPHDVDILLDQNYLRTNEDYKYLVSSQTKLFLGPRYSLIRREISDLREESLAKRNKTKLNRILISLGGIDLKNDTKSVLFALDQFEIIRHVEFLVVLGRNSPWIDDIKRTVETLNIKIKVLIDPIEFSTLLRDSDLIIGASGTSSWERCTLGIPTLSCIIAENQRDIALKLEKSGACKIIMHSDGLIDTDKLNRLFNLFFEQPSELQMMGERAAKICDGLGRVKIADCIMGWS